MTEQPRPCRFRGRMIVTIKTTEGKVMPVDYTADKVKLVTSTGSVVTGRLAVVDDTGRAFAGSIPHWYTCPKVDEARAATRKAT
jgi:hypothetical protein